MISFDPIGMCGYGLPSIEKTSAMGIEIEKELNEYRLAIVTFHFADIKGMDCEAMLDTGAYANLISRDFIAAFNLKEVGVRGVRHPIAGASYQPTFELNFKIEKYDRIFNDQFVRMPTEFNYPIILGAEFLRNCELIYDGVKNRFELNIEPPQSMGPLF